MSHLGSKHVRVGCLGARLVVLWALVTHLGRATPDTVVVFVSQSENNLLRAISLASFIYRHPVCPAVRLVAAEGKKSEELSLPPNNNIPNDSFMRQMWHYSPADN